jgi:hypothetical protein
MKPILFNTQMVQAILAGDKTQTRRVVKPQPPDEVAALFGSFSYGKPVFQRTPKYQVGDILWVRETWCEWFDTYGYKADNCDYGNSKWRPSIHMPREAARLFLLVTDVRAERLCDISYEDIAAEGITDPEKLNFPTLWNSTIKPKDREKYSFAANPWVFVYTFEKISKEETNT